jgi:hypothetical protein
MSRTVIIRARLWPRMRRGKRREDRRKGIGQVDGPFRLEPPTFYCTVLSVLYPPALLIIM